MPILSSNLKKRVAILLAFLLVLLSIPLTPAKVEAANNQSINLLLPVVNTDNSSTNPLIIYDSKINIRGELNTNVDEIANLRLRVKQQGDADYVDLRSLAPTYEGNVFTFTDVALKSGMNEIQFYIERGGNNYRYPYTVYIQYNSTPFISDLKINALKLNERWNGYPTVITVPSTNRLRADLTGTAKNTDKLVVNNITAGTSNEVTISRTGSFVYSLPVVLGENTLQIIGYSNNKQVELQEYDIIVTTVLDEDADQFYRVGILNISDTNAEEIILNRNRPQTVVGKGNEVLKITGEALLKFVETSDQELKNFTIDIINKANNTKVYTATIPKADVNIHGTTQPGYTGYSMSKEFTIGTDANLIDGNTYRVQLSYSYEVTDEDQNTTPYTKTVNNVYEFVFADSSQPRFVKLSDNKTGAELSQYELNVITSAIPEIRVDYANMNNISSNIKVFYNNSLLDPAKDDYKIEQPAGSNNSFILTLNKAPTGYGKLQLVYSSGAVTKSVTYDLNIVVTPYIYAYYKATDTEIVTVEDSFEYTDLLKDKLLYFQVYNFNLTNIATDMKVTFNNTDVTDKVSFSVDSGTGSTTSDGKDYKKLEIKFSDLTFQTGNNRLVITLNSNPKVTFTYNITYLNAKTPDISDVKLWVNDRKEELQLNSGDASYRTGALFLNEFTFTVNNPSNNTIVNVEKNGKIISSFKYDGSAQQPVWVPEEKYTDANNFDADLAKVLGQSEFIQFFIDHNFVTPVASSTGSTQFKASMSNVDYGDLLAYFETYNLNEARQNEILSVIPLSLAKSGITNYTITVVENGAQVARHIVSIIRTPSSWEVISPVKEKSTDPYIIVNANSIPVTIFAENATAVTIGKNQARVRQTSNPDYYYDDKTGRVLAKTYYVFETTVALKAGLNTIQYTVTINGQNYPGTLEVYNVNTPINGAQYRDTLGKKTSFSVFDKNLELKFPKNTVLLAPVSDRPGDEVRDLRSKIFVDVELLFAIADRTTGQISDLGGNNARLANYLQLPEKYNYASPLYYIDAGDSIAPGGRDPYLEDDATVDPSIRRLSFVDRAQYNLNLRPSEQGEISIKYDSSIVNAAKDTLTVLYHSGDPGTRAFDPYEGWQNLGGVVNTSKKTITVPFNGFGYYMVVKTRELYPDIVVHPYAAVDLETVFAKGLMPYNPYRQGLFGANDFITRGEMAQILVKILDLPINAGPYYDAYGTSPISPTFRDVLPSRDSWDYEYRYLETAARAGIIKGTTPGYFEPYNTLTRQDAAIMIARAMNLKLSNTPDDAMKKLSEFTDASDISYYARQYVEAVVKAGIMTGTPNDTTAKKPTYSFMPTSEITRAEMAVITVRIMKKLKKL